MIPRQEFSIYPSRVNLFGLGSVFIISIMVIFTLPFALFTQAALFLLLFCYEATIFWQHGLLKGRAAITQLICTDSHWLLQVGRDWVEAELMGETTVTQVLSVLCFRLSGGRRLACVIWLDSLHAGEYRRLRVVLKWGYAVKGKNQLPF